MAIGVVVMFMAVTQLNIFYLLCFKIIFFQIEGEIPKRLVSFIKCNQFCVELVLALSQKHQSLGNKMFHHFNSHLEYFGAEQGAF